VHRLTSSSPKMILPTYKIDAHPVGADLPVNVGGHI